MHEVHQRVAVVQHHVRRPARPQHAAHLGDRLLDVGRVVQHAEGVDGVEASRRGSRAPRRCRAGSRSSPRARCANSRATASAFSVRSTAVTSKPHFASWMLSTPIPHPTSSSLPWLPASDANSSREVVVRRVPALLDLAEVLVRGPRRVGVVLVVDMCLPEVLDRLDGRLRFGRHHAHAPSAAAGRTEPVLERSCDSMKTSCQSSKPIICHSMK